MDTTLAASPRSQGLGKGGARKARAAGRVPAVVYGPHADALSIEVDPHQLVELFRKTGNRNTVVELALAGETVPVLVREVQRHPVSRKLVHVDFYRLSKDKPVTVEVPVKPVGKAKGLALGGRVQLLRRTVTIRSAYDKIPKEIEVDVTPLDIDDDVRASGLILPEGAEQVYDIDYQVVVILGKQKEREELPVAAAEGAEGEAKEEEAEE